MYSHYKSVISHSFVIHRYSGSDGIYSHTVKYDRDEECSVCSPGVPMTIDPQITLSQVRLSHFEHKLHELNLVYRRIERTSIS